MPCSTINHPSTPNLLSSPAGLVASAAVPAGFAQRRYLSARLSAEGEAEVAGRFPGEAVRR